MLQGLLVLLLAPFRAFLGIVIELEMGLRDRAIPKSHRIPRVLLPSQTALPELDALALRHLVRSP